MKVLQRSTTITTQFALAALLLAVASGVSVVVAQTPPVAPTSLTAAGEPNQIRLDWDDNPEADLKGYHVFRSLTSGGPYTHLDGEEEIRQLQAISTSATTGEKPQSKVWRHGGYWWGVIPDNTGTWIWRLDQDAWIKTLLLSPATTVHADCQAEGDVTHILLYNGVASQLASVEFVSSTPPSYQFWSARPGLVDVVLSAGVETATIDLDSTDRMWVASDAASDIEVRHSDPPYSAWSAPVILAAGVSTDDICAVAALKDGTVGVLWSDQVTRRFGFRTHQDGVDPALWSPNEVPASQSAQNAGAGMADDHLNVAVASDNTLYAAVKTSYDTTGYPRIALLVRRPSGDWDSLYEVDQAGTRPVVVLNESRGFLRVLYTASEGLNDIVFKQSPLGSVGFAPKQIVVAGAWNNVASTKQNVATDLVALAANGSQVAGVLEDFNAPTSLLSEFVDDSADVGQDYFYVVSAENTAGQEGPVSSETSAAALPGPIVLPAQSLDVTVGTVAGGLQATTAEDGSAQTIGETSTGPKGRSGFAAEYILGPVFDREQVTSLVVQFTGTWTSLDGADPLEVAVWNLALAEWEAIDWTVGTTSARYEANLSAMPLDYIDVSSGVRLLFKDAAALDKEKKDTLAVDFLAALVVAGPDLPPASPENLQATSGDTLIRLTWDPSSETDVVGYDVERGGQLIVSLGLETEFIDTGLVNGVSQDYTVQAVDASGQTSDRAGPVAVSPDAIHPPDRPADLTATAGNDKVVLTWTGNLEISVVDYQIYRSTTTPVPIGPGTLLAEVSHGDIGAVHTFDDLDVNVSQDTTFYYTITATDLDDQVSAPSAEVAATVTVVSEETLVIVTAEYASKPKKLTVTATSTLGGAVVLSLFGGPDEENIDYGTPLLDALSYDADTGEYSARLRTASSPAWVGVASSGGGTPATAPVIIK